jgi:hypothetical protein
MSIRFKIANFKPYDGRIAYADLSGPDTGEVGSEGRLHFGQVAIRQGTAAGDAGDPIVIFQSFFRVGVLRLITHVVVPTGPLVLNGAPKETDHPHVLPVAFLARIKLPLLGAVPHPERPHRRATRAPTPEVRINDVLWAARQPVSPDWTLPVGSPFARHGGVSVCRDRLLKVLQNGQFDLAVDTITTLQAASEAGLNH